MPFAKGDPNINRSGRPKGFRAAILAKCGPNLEALVDFAWNVLTGVETTESERVSPTGELLKMVSKPTIAERQAAARFLAEYAEGKPAAKLEVSGQVDHAHFDYSRYTVDELRQLRGLLVKGQPVRAELPPAAGEGAVDAEFTASSGFLSRDSTQADQHLTAAVAAAVAEESHDSTGDDPADDPFGGEE